MQWRATARLGMNMTDEDRPGAAARPRAVAWVSANRDHPSLTGPQAALTGQVVEWAVVHLKGLEPCSCAGLSGSWVAYTPAVHFHANGLLRPGPARVAYGVNDGGVALRLVHARAIGPEARYDGWRVALVSGSGGGLERDAVAERLELFDEPACALFG